MRKVVFWGLFISLILAVVLSPFASSWPDGLERVADNLGFLGKGQGTRFFHRPIPDYIIPGIANEGVATAAAGVIGTLIVFGVVYGIGRLIKRRTQGDRRKDNQVGA